MYRKDILLETTDLELRLFIEYCKLLQPLYEDARYLNNKLQNRGVIRSNGSVLKTQRFKNVDFSDAALMQLIDEEEAAWKKYYEILNYVRRTKKILQILDQYELNLLYLRYERKLTFRQIGDIIGYSYMQVSRILDSILNKFE